MLIMSRQEEKSGFHNNEHIIKKVSLVSQPLFFYWWSWTGSNRRPHDCRNGQWI